ncbi:TolB-like translocation protein [Dethiobacter alkaliphilus]|uniref:hypothetical protein n=1 Tax=Dethiobacter alkaliphilus TaxID=427926 RepID=UPI002227A8AB|nr:hypothetical protein [Dethiobacter alkaliphilus]MCW3491655.1 hypothetical protein [Dethiobacter alkaliphilus]
MCRNNTKIFFVIIVLILILAGCNQKEIMYYSNPHTVFGEAIIASGTTIGDYKVVQSENILKIYNDTEILEISLPNYKDVQSLQLSYDKQYLAFDIKSNDGIKMFVVNLETGEYENISDSIGYLDYYDGYEIPFGISWSPTQNIIAFVGGYHGSPRVRLYHLEMDLGKQASGGSAAYPNNLYGVKWDVDGSSIYYVVDNQKHEYTGAYVGEEDYILYQTEISADDYLMGGEIIKVGDLTKEEFKQWLFD